MKKLVQKRPILRNTIDNYRKEGYMLNKAAVMKGPNTPVVIADFPDPELERGAVLLRTLASDLCGTDVHLFRGHLAGVPYPIIPGHISAGKVESIGGEVQDFMGSILQEGDVVTFHDVHETCYNCWYCLVAKATNKCPNRKVYGITYSCKNPPHLLGGWSEKIYLKPRVRVIKLPSRVSPQLMIAGGCALPTSIHAMDRAEVRLGDTVVVQGSGPVGLCAAILSQLSGAVRVIMVGAPKLRLDIAKSLGVDSTINIQEYDSESRVKRILELTEDRGADVVIEATGNPTAVSEGMRMVRDAGRFIVVGQYTNAGDVTINPHLQINKKHLEIRGTWGLEFDHLYRAVQILSRYADRFPWTDFITKEFTLSEANEAIKSVERLEVVKALIRP